MRIIKKEFEQETQQSGERRETRPLLQASRCQAKGIQKTLAMECPA